MFVGAYWQDNLRKTDPHQASPDLHPDEAGETARKSCILESPESSLIGLALRYVSR